MKQILINVTYKIPNNGFKSRTISKTITERRAFVDSLLENQRKVENRLDSVVKLADMVIDDATASGFTLKRIQETLEQKVKDR